MKYVVGNWKANKTVEEAKVWLDEFLPQYESNPKVIVILCPTYLHLPFLSSELKKLDAALKLGAQDVSEHNNGAHTGEITAQMLSSFVDYSLIGHSERRRFQKETDEQIENKVGEVLKYEINPILCVQRKETAVPEGVKIVAYEPVEAIGSGNPADPESTNKILFEIKKNYPYVNTGIYGGSVNSENVNSFLSQPEIDGVLPGGASLDAEEFAKIIKYASKTEA